MPSRELERFPDQIAVATSVADIHRIVESGRIAAILAIEGGEAIDGDLAVLRNLYRLGVDVSHISDSGFWDVLDASTKWASLSL
jgi:membrane dipeptidase